ncbi:DUF427 domain-containing protein [Fodinicola feengrottensis]|uniref:DUF427 domain-containing protein n=2 Tax=Fodinicola feengrottensis TaxID=435914 RepID=A0ABN2HLC9_9ACTN
MTLTFGGGPLSLDAPESVNYRIDGPVHRLFWQRFPRRVRAILGDQVILDSVDAKLLHESHAGPQLYVPRTDVRADLIVPSAHRAPLPYKGDAVYESLRIGERVVENAVQGCPEPDPSARWLAGHVTIRWDAMDAWFDEDEEIFGSFRDPYHRVDVRRTSRHVRVVAAGTEIAESDQALLVSETGLPNRFYLPADAVHRELLSPSATHTTCAYKGNASYRNLRVGDRVIPDAVWYYPRPLPDALQIAGYLCFLADGVQTWVDGKPID